MIDNLPKWVLPNNYPAFYDSESATAIEMVAKLYGAMKTLIEEHNTNSEEWKNTIDAAIEFMKDNLDESIVKSIEDMKNSGELNDSILSGLGNLNDNFLIKSKPEVNMNRLFRVLKERYRYGSDEYKTDFENTAYSLQSVCSFNNNLILGYTNGGSTKSTLEERTRDGMLIRSVNIPLGHCNSLTVTPTGTIYVATLNNTIVEVDYSTFTIIKSHNFDINFRAIAFDKIKGVLWGVSGKEYYTITLQDDTYSHSFTHESLTGIFQSFCVNDGMFYEVSSEPEILSVFTRDRMIGKYNISPYAGFYYFGEAEDIEYSESGLIMVSNWQTTFDNYRHGQVWSVPTLNDYQLSTIESALTQNGVNKIYCNSESTSMNPDGTINNPYKSISECISVLYSPLACQLGIEDLQCSGTFFEHVYCRSKKFRIIGNGTTVIKSGVQLQSCDVYFEGVTIENDDTSFAYSLYAQHSTVNGNNTYFKTLLDNQKNMILLSYSKAFLHGKFIGDSSSVTNTVELYFSELTGNHQGLIESAFETTDLYHSNNKGLTANV